MSARILQGDCLALMREMRADSFDSIVTDAPYGMSKPPDIVEVLRHWMAGEKYEHSGGGFMGAKWDSFVPGPRVWREALRVAKPGAHALVFASTRTVDLMGVACRLGGWEVRDTLHWCHWQGFPKSHDVSKAIDKMRHDREQVLQVTRWIAETRDAAGITNRAIDTVFGTSGMAGHWTSQKSQPAVPTLEQVPRLLEALGKPEVPEGIRRLLLDLNGKKGQPGAAWFDREVMGRAHRKATGRMKQGDGGYAFGEDFDITAPATEDAAKWNGFGTALKPAVEPILLLRKPLSESSTARNVLRWGTGAINIDGCRIPQGSSIWPGPQEKAPSTHSSAASGRGSDGGTQIYGLYGAQETHTTAGQMFGRFPANLLHFKKPSRKEKEAGCEGLPLVGKVRNPHPTVKPIALMRYLCRLVTPPGGDLLDPFTGSGTTGIGATMEGFNPTLCELNAAFCRVARARMRHWAPGLSIVGSGDPSDGPQLRMF